MSTPQPDARSENGDDYDANGVLAGPGATRQAKRLQLRKVGFRAKVVPNRNITPKTRPSESWSGRHASGSFNSAHRSFSQLDGHADSPEMRETSGALHEVSNSSRRRKMHSRPRIDDSFSIFEDENRTASPKRATSGLQASRESLTDW